MTSQVTAAELGRLRTDSSRWFTEDAVLVRIVPSEDGKGGFINTRPAIWSGKVQRKPVYETGRGVQEQDTGDIATERSHWMFSFPAEVDVKPQDEITASGRVYQVVGGMDKSIEIAHYVIAIENL